MTEKLVQRVFLALACCLVLIAIPAQISGQTQSGESFTWRDSNGNLHFQDEDGNYMINSSRQTDPNSNIQSDVDQILREKPSPQESTTRENLADDTDSGLPSTAGPLPLLAFIGISSLVGAGASRLISHARR